MKLIDNADFEARELSVDELDGIAAAGVWGWIKHEASSTVRWLGSEYAKLENAVGGGKINITIHRQN